MVVGGSKLNRAGSLLAHSSKIPGPGSNTHFSIQNFLERVRRITPHILIVYKRLQQSFHVHSFTQKRESLYPVAVLQYTSPQASGKGYVSLRLPVNIQPTIISVFQLHFHALVTQRPSSFGECEKTSVSFALICNSQWQPNHNWTVGEAQHIFLLSHTSKHQQINCSLAVDWLSSLRWQS